MSERELALVNAALEDWRRGDLGLVEALLDPRATRRGVEPGTRVFADREVIQTPRERHKQDFGRARLELQDAGRGSIVMVSWPREIGGEEWTEETATVISFRDERVVRYRITERATRCSKRWAEDECRRAPGRAKRL